MKRAPYADHIVVLDNKGHVIEQGSFKALDAAGGYVSSFALGLPEWGYKADLFPASGVQVEVMEKPDKPEAEIEADTRGKGGDLSIYLYYVQAIGWIPTIVFIVAIAAFAFCISFPSTILQSFPVTKDKTDLTQASGSNGGPAQMKRTPASTQDITLGYMPCLV